MQHHIYVSVLRKWLIQIIHTPVVACCEICLKDFQDSLEVLSNRNFDLKIIPSQALYQMKERDISTKEHRSFRRTNFVKRIFPSLTHFTNF